MFFAHICRRRKVDYDMNKVKVDYDMNKVRLCTWYYGPVKSNVWAVFDTDRM